MPKRRYIKRKRTARSSKPRGRRLGAEMPRINLADFRGAGRNIRLAGAGVKLINRTYRGVMGSQSGLGNLRGTHFKRPSGRRPRRWARMNPATTANIKSSPGLRIGKSIRLTKAQQITKIMNPPAIFNSKWVWQMDCDSGRVSAAQIPIMTQSLAKPIYDQVYTNLTTDNTVDPTMATSGAVIRGDNYQTLIENYRSDIRFYNSSTNTMRVRIVWYKPARDMDAEYEAFGANTNEPVNLLMLASNASQPAFNSITPVVGNGMVFDNTTAGSNYTTNYNHAGQPLTGTSTTGSSATNNVAQLDPSLVPGSVQVKRIFSHFWRTLKQEEFQLEPGNQYNTSVTMKNRIVRSQFDDTDVIYRRDSTIIGVVYVLGQIVFSDVAANYSISTGSSQLSIMREDTCIARPLSTKSPVRVNLTNPFQQLSDADQGIINTESGTLNTVYAEDA